ncbi:unnamed protein product [Rotaria socialis]
MLDKNPTFVRNDSSEVELLSVPDNKQNAVKYALKLIDILFTDKQDFQNIDVKTADEEPRIKSICAAVKRKFNYSPDEMSFVWPPIHDSILSKRRNQQTQILPIKPCQLRRYQKKPELIKCVRRQEKYSHVKNLAPVDYNI